MQSVYSLLFVFLLREVQSQQLKDIGDLCGLQSNGRASAQCDQISGAPGAYGLRGSTSSHRISSRPAASCMEHLRSGNKNSGIYSIKPTLHSATTEVYCDMESAGGGWTLVASVHENNIKGKCTTGDNWSSDGAISSSDYNGLRSWENYNVFGNVESATTADYKSAAYFNLEASDVMIWHVPNDVEINQWMNQSFLRYYTNSGFLNNYGGTLQSVFSKHFPMTKASSLHHSPSQLKSLLRILNGAASCIRSSIRSFYKYTYDSSGIHNYISDGGRDMFDSGNKVYYQIGSGGYKQITYGQTYNDSIYNVVVSSVASHPFFALMWIGNSNRRMYSFDLKVVSGSGADGSGNLRTLQGSISSGSFVLSYKILNIYNAGDPSISKVFFFIRSSTVWKSYSSSFTSINWPNRTDPLTNTMRLTGSPRSVMMGYTLLSSSNGREVTSSEAREALTRMLEIISDFYDAENENCFRIEESLVVPVNYLKGTDNQVVSHMPPDARTKNTPGYVQFRPLSHDGVPNALCSGFKTESCEPKYLCVGGINTRQHSDYRACGDFAAWDGETSDRPTATTPRGLAHSLNDIASSILIFTRSGAPCNNLQH